MKKTGISLALNLLMRGVAIVFGIYIARWLNKMDAIALSEYNYIIRYTETILTLLTFGVPSLIHKFYTNQTENEGRRQFWTVMAVFRLFTFFVGLIIILISYPLSSSNNLSLILILYAIQFLLIIDLAYRSICDALNRSWQFSLTDFLSKVLIVTILYFSTFAGNYEIKYYLVALATGYTFGLSLDAFLQRKDTNFGPFKWQIFRDNFRSLFILGINGIIASIYLNMDILLMGQFKFTPEQINGYSNAYKLYSLGTVIPFLTIPPLASIFKKRLDNLKTTKISQKVVDLCKFHKLAQIKKVMILEGVIYASLVGLLSSVISILLGRFLVEIIDTDKRFVAESMQALPFMFAANGFIYPLLLLSNLIVFFDGEKYEFYLNCALLLICAIAYPLLIPNFGLQGAAFVILFYTIISFVLRLFFVNRILNQNSGVERKVVSD